MFRYAPGLALTFVMAANLSAQTTKAATDQAFEAVYATFSEAYRKADPQLVTNLYTRDAFYLQPGSKIERGHDYVLNVFSFLNQYKNRPSGGPAIGFRIVDRQVSGNIGWDIGYYLMNPNGQPITSEQQPDGKFIVLWKQGDDGKWRIFADGYSDVRPPEPPPSAERTAAQKAIVRAVNAYFDGIMNNDSVKLDIAFHPDAELSATMPNGHVYRAPYSEWRKFTTRPKGDPTGKKNNIVDVDINGNAAVVTTVLDWPAVRYVDYLSLIKTGEDEWKIVSKIWHQEAKPAKTN
jgi:ketosteroid isomerase-like protein